MPEMDRRTFLRSAGLGSAALALPRIMQAADPKRRPNIVFIITDQQAATMMSCTGNRWLKTPALDRLAAGGVRFERAYAANPVCLPNRFSLFTGHMPSKVGIRHNGDGRNGVPKRFAEQAMGHLFRKAGYETVYGGKVHLPRGMGVQQCGFRGLTSDSRGKLAEACAQFIKGKHERPFLLVASFINPHDICYMAINDHRRTKNQRPIGNLDSRICEGLIAEPRKRLAAFVEQCPPLPANHAVPDREPEAITEKFLKGRMFRYYARAQWPDEMWRLHRWAYCRLTEMVDRHVGVVLDALRDAGIEENTLVVFTSDHGDHDASHKLEHKSILYDEAARIPLVLSWKGHIPAGRVDDHHLVSNGLDILPTVCDAAGIASPKGLLGASILPVARGDRDVQWRGHLAAECRFGRMLRTMRYKYVVYDSGENREQLFDLQTDPGETRSLADDPKHKAVLDEHRKLLAAWVERAGDAIGKQYVIA